MAKEGSFRSIRTRLQTTVFIIVVFSTLLVASLAIHSMFSRYKEINKEFHAAFIDIYKKNLKYHVESIASILNSYTQSLNGNITPDVEEKLKYIIHNASYENGEGYFFLYDLNGLVIAHGDDLSLEGKNLLNMRGIGGTLIIKDLRDAAVNGTGFLTYYWNKPNSNKILPKLSYVTTLKNAPLWVGTGVYINNIDTFMATEQAKQISSLHHLILQFSIFTLSLIILSLAIAFYFAGRISQPIIHLSRLAKKISDGDYNARVEVTNNDELGAMANAFNLMADNISHKIKALTASEQYIRRLFESVGDGLLVTDTQNRIVQANTAAATIFETTEMELINSNINFLLPTLGTQETSLLNQVLQNKITLYREVTRINKNGIETHLAVTISPVIEHDDQVKLVIYSITDITEQTQLKIKVEQMNNLKKYFPTQVAEKLMEGNASINMDYDRKKITIFFSDLAGFTDLSDSMEAEEITTILGEYLTSMSKIVYKYSGTLDKFIGDAIMVFFGAPSSNGVKQDAINCVKMALEMQEKLIELNKSWNLIAPLQMRIGINTGFATVGNFGSDQRLEYTVIGTPVNIASRLEHASPLGGILISHDTAQYVKDEFVLEEKDPIQLKGIHRPVKTFQVSGVKS